MAVPSSGQLSLLGFAREKQFDDYSSTSTPYTPISLLDLAETFVNFDGTNTNGVSYPNSTKPHAMSEWYGYDHDYGLTCTSLFAHTLGYNPSFTLVCSARTKAYYTNSSDWAASTQLYQDQGGNSCIPASAGYYYKPVGGGANPVRYWNGSAFTSNSGCP